MHVARLRLETARIEELQHFYAQVLECPLVDETPDSFAVGVGEDVLEFGRALRGQPTYRFSLLLPRNRFRSARDWLLDRVDLLREPVTGEREFFFRELNANAVYCQDPAGNVVGFVARHRLPTDARRPFDGRTLQGIADVGLPVPNKRVALDQITQNVGVETSAETIASAGDAAGLTYVGDDRGALVLATTGTAWFPTRDRQASVFPIEITLDGIEEPYRFPGLPYRIRTGNPREW